MGVVEELGTVSCPVTGRNVILWDVNSKLPLDLPLKKTKKQAKEDAIKELRNLYKKAENKELRGQFVKVSNLIKAI